MFCILDGHGANGDKASELVKFSMKSTLEDEILWSTKQKPVFINSDFG